MATIDASPPLADTAYQWPPGRPLLTAEWRNLVMLNYEVDPAAVEPFVPRGVELDFEDGRTYVSLVGFQFLRTRFFGLAVPFHMNFVEVNLRFYIRRRAPEGWRRGVVFIRELAPRRAVALVANMLYGERYLTVPMSHAIIFGTEPEDPPTYVEYGWRYRGAPYLISLDTAGPAQPLETGTHPEFIAEHYWGYSSLSRGRGKEYQVAHPTWSISPAAATQVEGDLAPLYGKPFAECLQKKPVSAFWVNGSPVRVYPGKRL